MRNLTLRIFVSFWLIIGLLVALAAAGGYAYSERLREAYANFEIDDTIAGASAALDTDGERGLVEWLSNRPASDPFTILVVTEAGVDLLDRRLPPHVHRMIRRFAGHRSRHRGARNWNESRSRRNVERARPFTLLRGSDGATYSVFALPKRDPWRAWIAERAGPVFLLLAILISASVSYGVARAITRPVRSFRDATLAIAEGKLDTRVSPTMRRRRDEIGLLARDLDSMASRLESAAAQQTELTRNISHELRSPLARLRVALELARRDAGDAPALSRIEKEAERLDALIGQLLSYSRLESKTSETREPVRLQELLEQTVEDVNYECRASGVDGVTVVLDDAAVDITLPGFADALTSAVENVLRNAVRHSPPQTSVEVALRLSDGNAYVTVADRGPGVSDAQLERIFEPFVTSAASEDLGGTGLGLAIARRAIDKHGGDIVARNRDGGGLVITIALPTE